MWWPAVTKCPRAVARSAAIAGFSPQRLAGEDHDAGVDLVGRPAAAYA
jgi:hypothetical protein